MANEYATLLELKAIRGIVDNADDDLLQTRLTRASRAIDTRCRGKGGHFYADGATSVRTYPTRGRTVSGGDGELLLVDDISTATGLIVEVGDGTTWTAVTDYIAEPDNAIARGRAVEALRRDLGCWSANRRVRVTANWGWPSVPDEIAEATLLLANRRFVRKNSPEGVSGWATEGAVRVSRFDPDIEDLVEPYVVTGFGS